MTLSLPGLKADIDELLAVLDAEIELLDARRSQLEALSVAIVARDDARMEALLNEIQDMAQPQADVDLRLEQVRRALAGALACPRERMTLQFLTEVLQGRQRAEIESRRRRIVELAQGLRQLMCGSRKFALEHISRDDLACLTHEAADISGIPFVTDVDKEAAEEILNG